MIIENSMFSTDEFNRKSSLLLSNRCPCSVVRLILQIVCSIRLAFKTVNPMWLTPWSGSLEIRVQIPAGAPLLLTKESVNS